MFNQQDRDTVQQYFNVFNPAPPVTIDAGQNTNDEAYLLIEGGGLSIGRHVEDVPALGGNRPGVRFRVYNHEGEDDGQVYTHLDAAVGVAMMAYARELFRRVNDKIVTEALAQELLG